MNKFFFILLGGLLFIAFSASAVNILRPQTGELTDLVFEVTPSGVVLATSTEVTNVLVVPNFIRSSYFNATNTAATSTFNSGLTVKGGVNIGSDICDNKASGGTLTTNQQGDVICEDDDTGSGAFTGYDAYTHPYAVTTSATTSRMLFTGGVIGYGSSTFSGFLSTGVLLASTSLTVTPLTSSLIITDGAGLFAEYTGTSCSNQFVRSLSALGAATCATVGTADVAGLDISDDTNLTATLPLVLTGDALSLQGSIFNWTPLTISNILYSSTSTRMQFTNGLVSFGSQFPFVYLPDIDFTTSNTRLTLTSQVAAPEDTQSLRFVYRK